MEAEVRLLRKAKPNDNVPSSVSFMNETWCRVHLTKLLWCVLVQYLQFQMYSWSPAITVLLKESKVLQNDLCSCNLLECSRAYILAYSCSSPWRSWFRFSCTQSSCLWSAVDHRGFRTQPSIRCIRSTSSQMLKQNAQLSTTSLRCCNIDISG